MLKIIFFPTSCEEIVRQVRIFVQFAGRPANSTVEAGRALLLYIFSEYPLLIGALAV
jgi:hypothetical protein